MGYAWYDVVGNVGVACIIGAYLALQLGRMDAKGLAFSAVNAVGAALVLVSLVFAFNLSAFVIEAFWVAISLIGVVRGWRARRATAPPPGGGA